MPNIEFTESEILSLGDFSAGWYPMALRSVEEGPGTKDPSSTTYTCEFEVIDGERKGAMLTTWFSTKMPANIFNYIKCWVPKPASGQKYPIESTKDKPVMGYVTFDLERNANVIKAFKPVGK